MRICSWFEPIKPETDTKDLPFQNAKKISQRKKPFLSSLCLHFYFILFYAYIFYFILFFFSQGRYYEKRGSSFVIRIPKPSKKPFMVRRSTGGYSEIGLSQILAVATFFWCKIYMYKENSFNTHNLNLMDFKSILQSKFIVNERTQF